MEKSNCKFRFLIVFILGFTGIALPQEKATLFEAALWIKNPAVVSTGQVDTLNESELKKYLNFNPSVDFSGDKVSRLYKNLVHKKSSLFIVFKSASEEETVLFSIERGIFKATIGNKKIVSDKETSLNRGDATKGTIISFIYNRNSLVGKKKGLLRIDDPMLSDKEFKNQLLELIYVPKCLNNKEKEIIESYLSVKYGISLKEGQNYYNSKGDIIWDAKENGEFSKRVTGIGHDSFFDLNQKQSRNSLADGLSIGYSKIEKVNTLNQTPLPDKTFLIWGDNGKNCVFEKQDENNLKAINRIWKMAGNSPETQKHKTQLVFDKKLMKIENENDGAKEEFIWLGIDTLGAGNFNYAGAKYIKAGTNDENQLVFNDVEWSANANWLFTLVKAPEKAGAENAVSTILITDPNAALAGVSDAYMVYPNPAAANQNFTIQFDLKSAATVAVEITDLNGKVIKSKPLGVIEKYLFTDSLPTSGTYLIIVSINGKIETTKLIIK